MRFETRWWTTHADSEVPFSEAFEDLDSALARGEQLWATGRTTKVAVLIDQKEVVWKQPVD
jgi:hypothetical protein